MATRFEVEKFDGQINFTIWKRRMKDALVSAKLWKVITRERPELGKKTGKNSRRWHSLPYIADSVLSDVEDETTAVGLLHKLERLFAGKNLTNKLWRKQVMYSLRMSEGDNLIEYVQKFNTAVHEVTEFQD